MKRLLVVLLFIFSATTLCAGDKDIATHLQNISVTILAPGDFGQSSGSGVLITRDLKNKASDADKVKTNFVWTAAHVVDSLRSTREIIDSKTGTKKNVIEFKPVFIVKDLIESGRKVGETRMEGKVIKYSDSETGEDLAVLMLLKKDFIQDSTQFNSKDIVPVGTQLFHVGSLLGQDGSNSMTTGIVSQIGRVINLSGGNSPIFDQTTVTAFPGSSGGGVFLASGPNAGKYVGMLVRGAGETFNLIVPMRRMYGWAETNKLEWALDESKEAPSIEDILKTPVE